MKKVFLLQLLFVLFFSCASSVAMPVYTDDIPQSYINKVKYTKNLNLEQALPVIDESKYTAVRLYTPKPIILKGVVKMKSLSDVYIEQNYNIGDKVNFVVAEDVYKNNKLFIKKGTIAEGLVRDAQWNMGDKSAPHDIQLSMFKTKDVNNKTVELYGTIGQEGKDTGLFQLILGAVPSISYGIPKNKEYTLYCK